MNMKRLTVQIFTIIQVIKKFNIMPSYKKSKKFNSSTGGYKIDIFADGVYYCSTDWYKRCKDAIQSVAGRKGLQGFKITANFDYQFHY